MRTAAVQYDHLVHHSLRDTAHCPPTLVHHTVAQQVALSVSRSVGLCVLHMNLHDANVCAVWLSWLVFGLADAATRQLRDVLDVYYRAYAGLEKSSKETISLATKVRVSFFIWHTYSGTVSTKSFPYSGIHKSQQQNGPSILKRY